MQNVVSFIYTEDKGIVEIINFNRDLGNRSVGFAPIFLSKMKGFRQWISRYQFLKARIVDDTAYRQKLNHVQNG